MLDRESAVRVWQLGHMAVFAAWYIGALVAGDHPAWSLASTMAMNVVCTAIAILVIPMVRHESVRQFSDMVAMARARRCPVFGAFKPALSHQWDAAAPPPILLHRTPAWTLLLAAVFSLPSIGWYFVNVLSARSVVPSVSVTGNATYIQCLADRMWTLSPGATIVVLVILSLTCVLRVIDIVVAAIALADGCRRRPDH